MLVKIEARILIFPDTDFHFPSTSVPPGTFFRLWSGRVVKALPLAQPDHQTKAPDRSTLPSIQAIRVQGHRPTYVHRQRFASSCS